MVRIKRDKAELGNVPFVTFNVSHLGHDKTTVWGSYNHDVACQVAEGRCTHHQITVSPFRAPVDQAFKDACRYAQSKGISAIWIDDPDWLFDMEQLRLTPGMTHDIQSLAYHEAGHAVVARHFGCDLISVRIYLDNRSGGAMVKGCGLKGRQDGLVALAGYAAEALSGYAISDDPDRMGCFNDIAIAQQAVSDMTGLGIRDDGFDNAFDALMAETKELIRHPTIWSAVKALAAVLTERHTIDGAAAMAIVDPILGKVADHS